MTAKTYGMLAGAVALGAWWWNRNRMTSASPQLTAARERGTVIFDNTPTVAETLEPAV